MGLFSRKTKIVDNSEASLETKFFGWLDGVLGKKLPSGIEAIAFNLYEDADNNWSIELVGSSYFSETDPDWPCSEVYTTRENPFSIKRELDWGEIEKTFTDLVNLYLEKGQYSDDLKQYQAIGIGFVDGDTTIIYKK